MKETTLSDFAVARTDGTNIQIDVYDRGGPDTPSDTAHLTNDEANALAAFIMENVANPDSARWPAAESIEVGDTLRIRYVSDRASEPKSVHGEVVDISPSTSRPGRAYAVRLYDSRDDRDIFVRTFARAVDSKRTNLTRLGELLAIEHVGTARPDESDGPGGDT